MLREYDCPSCGYRIDSLASHYQCPRCHAVLPSHEANLEWKGETQVDQVRPEEMLRPHADPRFAHGYAGADEVVKRDSGAWLVWVGAFVMTMLLTTTAWGFLDLDRDGLAAWQEIQDGTNPFHSDTDHDGLPDGWEVTRSINPQSNDTDHDGLLDRAEVTSGFDPRFNDTDGNGLSDAMDAPPPPPSCPMRSGNSDARCDLRDPPWPAAPGRTLLAFFGAAIAVSILVATLFTVWWRSPDKNDDD